ncbi:spore coat protein U domain-containing protein [Sphingomonas sp. ac-8]|uniref:spore coat protein U domain-containing protein n=1 Tax=Sphingomonas sp. ac-8 TaxID=3242977 RepID=UPI003A8135D8
MNRMPLRLLCRLLGVVLAFVAVPASACTVTKTREAAIGSYSQRAVQQRAVPALRTFAGLQCPPTLLVLLGTKALRGTFTSANAAGSTTAALRLVRSDGQAAVAYTASAGPDGTAPFAQGKTVDYAQNKLLDVLGLLGGDTVALPIFVTPAATSLPPVGVYKDTITLAWDWHLCSLVDAPVVGCVGELDEGIGKTVLTVTLTVTEFRATLSMTSATTWDPVHETRNPRDLPESRRAVSVAFGNPDIVPLESGTIDIVVPTPTGTILALDGDKATPGPAIRLVQGSTSSGLAASYNGPTDPSDDVEFSTSPPSVPADKRDWSYLPAGDAASEVAVTFVRVRARGAMAARSSFAARVPYRIPPPPSN